jgi:hypothetical protein
LLLCAARASYISQFVNKKVNEAGWREELLLLLSDEADYVPHSFTFQ